MKDKIQSKAAKYVKENKEKKLWQRFVSGLSAVAVFFTTYAMILPAVTWERSLVCEIPEHQHDDSCYETVIVPAEKQLVCTLSEHMHGLECYESVLICGKEECEGHIHGEGCYNEAGELVCTIEESEGHVHSEECYERILVCTEQEHVHTDECYETIEEHEEKVLVCQLEEHEHTASCYDAPPAEDDGYYCGQIEHIHSEEQGCYFSDGSLRCTITEHVHTLACMSNPKADVETEDDWCSTFADVSLTGNWADDVIAVAETQIGYTESTENYEVQEDGISINGYTRYGDWYGDKYGDWCAMFVSFCLNYAGIGDEYIPYAQDCAQWVEWLTEGELYAAAHCGYSPKKGDIIFFDYDEDGLADNAGIVSDVNLEDGIIYTIEGDSDGCVARNSYSLTDVCICGFGLLTENPYKDNESPTAFAEELKEAVIEYTTEDGITITLSGMLPDGARIVLSEVSEETLTEILEQVGANSSVFAYDITIVDSYGNEWQPDENGVNVTITGLTLEEDSLKVVHVLDEGELEEVDTSMDGDTLTFTAPGFSVYVGLNAQASSTQLTYTLITNQTDAEEIVTNLNIREQLGLNENVAIASVTSANTNIIKVSGTQLTVQPRKTTNGVNITIKFAGGKTSTVKVKVVDKYTVWSYPSTLSASGITIKAGKFKSIVTGKSTDEWVGRKSVQTSKNCPAGYYYYYTPKLNGTGGSISYEGETYYIRVASKTQTIYDPDDDSDNWVVMNGKGSSAQLPCVYGHNVLVMWLEDASGNKVILQDVCVGNEGSDKLWNWQFGGSDKTIYTNDIDASGNCQLKYNDKADTNQNIGDGEPSWTGSFSAKGKGTKVSKTNSGLFQGILPDENGYYTMKLEHQWDEISVFQITETEEKPIHHVTVAKQVSGDNSEPDKEYSFKVYYTNTKGKTVTEEFTMKDGENKVFAVLEGTKFETWEIEESDAVYSTKYSINGNNPTDGKKAVLTTVDSDASVTFFNSYGTETQSLSVVKTFTGLTAVQVQELINDFCITLTDSNGDWAADFRLNDTDVTVSEDNMTYTWEVSLEQGQYTVTETGADLPGYIRSVDGLGTITVPDDPEITITNIYKAGFILPETGGIGVYQIYASGVLLFAGSIISEYILKRKSKKRTE